MNVNQGKYDIEVQNDDAIKRNRVLYDFIQQTFNRLDGLYLHENIPLIDTTTKNKSRNQSVTKVETLNIQKGKKKK